MNDTIKLIDVLAEHGPGFIVAGIVLALYFFEKKSLLKAVSDERVRSDELAKAVFTLSSESIKADTEHTAAIQALTKVLDNIDRRIHR